MNNLAVTPGQDLLSFSWDYDYSPDASTFFNLYRFGTLVACLNDTLVPLNDFDYLDAPPGFCYDFSLKAYNLVSDSLSTDTEIINACFPEVSMVASFDATPDNANGWVDLSWTHTSTNFSGFRIYRNNEAIATLANDVFTYQDLEGAPGTITAYAITAIRTVDEADYESNQTFVAPVQFPQLVAPNALTATASPAGIEDHVSIDWNTPAPLNPTYNYTGFHIYRDADLIGTIRKEFAPPFKDYFGVPGQSYTYTVRSFNQLADTLYESAPATANAVFPSVLTPAGFNATTSPGKVELSWDNYPSTNFDGFYIFRELDTLGIVAKGQNTYTNYVNNLPASTNYSIKAFRDLNGERYVSAAANTIGGPLVYNSFPELPTNVFATFDIPNHIKLCWDYPIFILSHFNVYRDGVLLGVLPTEARAYYDYSAIPGTTHEYEVEAVNLGNVAQRVGTEGRLRSIKHLYGKVTTTTSGLGIPNLRVTAEAPDYQAVTYTDATGYYRFAAIPDFAGTIITVTVEPVNNNILPLIKTATIGVATAYEVNFEDTFELPTTNEVISTPTAVTTITDPVNMLVEISWTFSNDNYSGFEVNRSNATIAVIERAEPMLVLDSLGSPGIDYTYQVRSFWDTDEGRVYSDFVGADGRFPQLAPAEFFTATPIDSASQVLLQWSHPYDNHDYYIVERNGEPIALVEAGTPLFVQDSTGFPGQQYNYSVKATNVSAEGFLFSDPVTASVEYPEATPVSNLQASIPQFELASADSTNFNHVLLEWEYTSPFDEGFEVYRNAALIATLPKGARSYEDYEGLPEGLSEYKVSALLVREGNTYFSDLEEVDLNFPILAEPDALDAQPIVDSGYVELKYRYRSQGAEGFYVFKKLAAASTYEVIDTLEYSSPNTDTIFTWIDRDGTPGLAYDYVVQAYSERDSQLYLSEFSIPFNLSAYPDPARPFLVAASRANDEAQIKVSWEYPLHIDVDGFEVYRDGDFVTALDQNQRSFSEIIDNTNSECTRYYAVKAVRTIDGTDYLSAAEGDFGHVNTKLIQSNPPGGLGFGVEFDIDNEWAMAGHRTGGPGGKGLVEIYKKQNEKWIWHQQLESPLQDTSLLVDFGSTVAFHGEWAAISYAEIHGGSNVLKLYFYRLENDLWVQKQIIDLPDLGSTALWELDMHDGRLILEQPTALFATPPEPKIYELIGEEWFLNYTITAGTIQSNSSSNLQISVDIFGDFAVVGNSAVNGPGGFGSGEVFVFYRDPNLGSWNPVPTTLGTLVSGAGFTDFSLLGRAVAIHGDHIAVPYIDGGLGITDAANVVVFKHTGNNNWVEESFLDPAPVDFTISSPFDVSINQSHVGILNDDVVVNLYQYDSGSLTNRRSLTTCEPTSLSRARIVMNGSEVFYGTDAEGISGVPLVFEATQGAIYHERIVPLDPGTVPIPQDFLASDGTFSNKVEITWTLPNAQLSTINGFQLYRDDELIQVIPPVTETNIYFDLEAFPGKEHVYTLRCVQNGVGLSVPVHDYGSRQANGSITGSVFTEMTGDPVEGIKVTAIGIANCNYNSYETFTDQDGNFVFEQVAYDAEGSDYVLTPSFMDHEFGPPSATVSLAEGQSAGGGVVFLDKTAYVITGTVARRDVDCGLEGVTVRTITTNDQGFEITKEVETTADGFYSLVVNPWEPGLVSVKVEIDAFTLEGDVGNQDTVYYDFVPSGPTFFSNIDPFTFPINTTLNFTDELTYDVPIFVRTACGSEISTSSFFVRARTIDGCYDKTFFTNDAGFVRAPMPPLDLQIAVVGVDEPTTLNLVAVDYLQNRPGQLSLDILHRNVEFRQKTELEQETEVTQQFVFHKPPAIEITSTSNDWEYLSCGQDPVPVAKLKQNTQYNLRFGVSEIHDDLACPVQSGKIVVTNGAADTIVKQVNFDPETGLFELYKFTAGSPNIVEPYLLTMVVEYFSENDDFLASRSYPIVVTGSTELPGADVFVNPNSTDGQVNLPVMILRDPPGDASSSSISAGQTIEKTLSLQESTTIKAGAFGEASGIVTAFGPFFEASIDFGGSTERGRDWQYSMTTSSAYSTSGSPLFIGPDADVIIGHGIAIQYGLTRELKVEGCNFKLETRLGITGNSVPTTWVYTVGQIKNFIKEIDQDILAIQNGTKDITGLANVPNFAALQGATDDDKAISLLRIRRGRWEKILLYHRRETLPHYKLCTSTLETAGFQIDDAVIDQINQWKCGFCSKLPPEFDPRMEYDCGTQTFQFFDDSKIVWDEELVTAYNQAEAAIRNLRADPLNIDGALGDWTFNDDNLGDIGAYVDAQYNASFGIGAENITFGAGTQFVKSLEGARASSKNYGNSFLIDETFAAGFVYENETTATTAGGSGGLVIAILGIEKKLTKFSSKFGINQEVNFEIREDKQVTETSTVGISYTLEDDDPGDQFSVTAIQAPAYNHTPYFSLLGGRSSCPPEAGTILRGSAEIALYDPILESTSSEASKFNVNPDSAALFFIQLTNTNPFGEAIDITTYLENSTNNNGATVRLGSALLGEDVYFAVPSEPIILPLTIERGEFAYQFDSIQVCARPWCADGTTLDEVKCVYVNVDFESPCSEISIIGPDENWVVNRRDATNPNSREEVIIKLRDYDPNNPNLENVYLEYRRLGTGQAWDLIPNAFFTRDSLANYNELFFAPGETPTFNFVWDITDNFDDYPDGLYQIRAIASCGTNGQIFSNVVTGKIDRSTIALFGLPQPADGLWTAGDEISATFNKNIDCALFQDTSFLLTRKSDGSEVPVQVSCFNNKLIFTATQPMSTYDGDTLVAQLADVIDLSGNRADTIRWEFAVITHPLYWELGRVSVQRYQGEDYSFFVPLNNTEQVAPISNVSLLRTDVSSASWLDFDAGPLTVLPSGLSVEFNIDGDNPLGTYSDTILVEVPGQTRQPALIIDFEILARPPYWVFDPSLYPDNMNVISNWRFTTDPSGAMSIDSMDLISAWIGSELRGVASIEMPGNNFHAAYLTVYGIDSLDNGVPIEFRIWDASTGIEYTGHPDIPADTVFFEKNRIEGSTTAPLMLLVDEAYDRARYIPLNQGWTWFSFNSEENDLNLNNFLRSLKSPTNGDILKIQDQLAYYIEDVGWYAPLIMGERLDSADVHDGYLIYLTNQADTLRITGLDATYQNQLLLPGWSQIGYPLQNAMPVNTVFNVLNVADGDLIKTVSQTGVGEFAVYDSSTGWLGSLTELKPYFAYQVFFNNPVIIDWPGSSTLQNIPSSNSGENGNSGPEPMNPESWNMDPEDFGQNMVVTAVIEWEGVESLNPGDQVAAFVGGELRGVGELQYIPPLDRYVVSCFVYSNAPDERVEFFLYNAATDEVYRHHQLMDFEPNGRVGTIGMPYVFSNSPVLDINVQTLPALCATSPSGGAYVVGITGGQAPYLIEWNDEPGTSALENLLPGTYQVRVIDAHLFTRVMEVTVEHEDAYIAVPEVVINQGNVICYQDYVWISADSEQEDASFKWFDVEGNLLSEGSSVVIPNIQEDQHIYLETSIGDCAAELQVIALQVQKPMADFTALPEGLVTLTEGIQFSPVADVQPHYLYYWNFGDGGWSEKAEPYYFYEDAGSFDVELQVTDTEGCSNSFTRSDYIQVALQTGLNVLPDGKAFLSAFPNPFIDELKLMMNIPKGGAYQLELFNVIGERVWEESMELTAGIHALNIDLGKQALSNGLYNLILTNAKGEKISLSLQRVGP